jgi:hypothetical protein
MLHNVFIVAIVRVFVCLCVFACARKQLCEQRRRGQHRHTRGLCGRLTQTLRVQQRYEQSQQVRVALCSQGCRECVGVFVCIRCVGECLFDCCPHTHRCRQWCGCMFIAQKNMFQDHTHRAHTSRSHRFHQCELFVCLHHRL